MRNRWENNEVDEGKERWEENGEEHAANIHELRKRERDKKKGDRERRRE